MHYPKEPEFNIVYDIVTYILNNAKSTTRTQEDATIRALQLRNIFTRKLDNIFEEELINFNPNEEE